jgi:hypothetical protein
MGAGGGFPRAEGPCDRATNIFSEPESTFERLQKVSRKPTPFTGGMKAPQFVLFWY